MPWRSWTFLYRSQDLGRYGFAFTPQRSTEATCSSSRWWPGALPRRSTAVVRAASWRDGSPDQLVSNPQQLGAAGSRDAQVPVMRVISGPGSQLEPEGGS